MHLAEYRATFSTKRIVQEGAPISVSGSRRWATFEDVDIDSSDFDRIGEDFLRSEAGHAVRQWPGWSCRLPAHATTRCRGFHGRLVGRE